MFNEQYINFLRSWPRKWKIKQFLLFWNIVQRFLYCYTQDNRREDILEHAQLKVWDNLFAPCWPRVAEFSRMRLVLGVSLNGLWGCVRVRMGNLATRCSCGQATAACQAARQASLERRSPVKGWPKRAEPSRSDSERPLVGRGAVIFTTGVLCSSTGPLVIAALLLSGPLSHSDYWPRYAVLVH